MTERASQQAVVRTSLCLLAALVLSCATSGNDKVLVLAQPEPLSPGFIYGDNIADDAENLVSNPRTILFFSSPTTGRRKRTRLSFYCGLLLLAALIAN
jgi:hypothetical protein